MPHLHINFQLASPDITLDKLITRISEQIPGTTITTEDWYARRRLEEARVIEKLRELGNPMHHGNYILRSVDNAAVTCGPTKGISIPMGGNHNLVGRISRKIILVYSDNGVDKSTVDKLLEVLRPLGTVTDFQTSDLPTMKSPYLSE